MTNQSGPTGDQPAGMPALFDPAELLDRMGGEVEAVVELLDIFLEDTPEVLSELVAAGPDLPRLAKAAHALKGSSANMAAAPVSAAAAEVEAAAKQGDAQAAFNGRERLIAQTRQLLALFEDERRRLGVTLS